MVVLQNLLLPQLLCVIAVIGLLAKVNAFHAASCGTSASTNGRGQGILSSSSSSTTTTTTITRSCMQLASRCSLSKSFDSNRWVRRRRRRTDVAMAPDEDDWDNSGLGPDGKPLATVAEDPEQGTRNIYKPSSLNPEDMDLGDYEGAYPKRDFTKFPGWPVQRSERTGLPILRVVVVGASAPEKEMLKWMSAQEDLFCGMYYHYDANMVVDPELKDVRFANPVECAVDLSPSETAKLASFIYTNIVVVGESIQNAEQYLAAVKVELEGTNVLCVMANKELKFEKLVELVELEQAKVEERLKQGEFGL